MESEAKRRKIGEGPRPVIMDATQAMLRIEELERSLADRQIEINRLKAEVRMNEILCFPFLGRFYIVVPHPMSHTHSRPHGFFAA